MCHPRKSVSPKINFDTQWIVEEDQTVEKAEDTKAEDEYEGIRNQEAYHYQEE